MTITEIPAGDSEHNKPTETVEAAPSPPAATEVVTASAAKENKGIKASNCERVLFSFLIAIAVILAIGGLTFTLVRESNGKNVRYDCDDAYWNHYDDYYYDDDSFDFQAVNENPFDIDVEYFTSRPAEPYASVEELREDIEVLAKQLANTVILKEANHPRHNHHFYDDAEFGMIAESSSASDAKASAPTPSVPDGFFRGVDDFETYQHELGAVKDDMVKSNGQYVFTAVDYRIQVWDLEGNLFDSTILQSFGNNLYINALVMNPEGTKLIAIASDYNQNVAYDYIISSARQTKVVVFNIEGSSLTKVSETNIDGNHESTYSVGNNVHIVTKASLNTWVHFDDNLYRYSVGASSSEEYVEKAKEVAEERIIPNFVDQLVDLVTDGDEILLSPIVGFPSYQSLTQITSFDLSQIASKADLEANISTSMVLQPGHTGYVYATADWLWVADEDWSWGWFDDSETETTLLGFRLDGATTNFAAVGTIPGQLLSQFSIDFVEDQGKEYVRVAITQNSFNNWWGPRPFFPQPIPEPEPVFMENMEVEEVVEALPGKRKLEEREPEPIPVISESSTLNEIIIFEVPAVGSDSNELNRLGSVEVGKKDELITAIRFFDKISYVVTFERTDPFYVLDLSDPMNPMVLGELEVPGFSEFMHPITADNSVLLTVGQDADENGVVTGFQISIFDSTDPSDPQLVDRLVLEGASSAASWDERAFRYIQVGDVGRLIIPISQYNYDRFGNPINTVDGFSVFGVNLNNTEAKITRQLDINHWEDYSNRYNERGCWCGGVYLPTRSMVFDGNLMSMKSSKIVSTDLASGENQWTLTLNSDDDCCNF